MWRQYILCLCAVLLAAFALPTLAAMEAKDPDLIHVTPFPPGGDFVLMSPQGPASLADLRGMAVLLFFGYTNCPDVCPMSMTTASEAYKQLKPADKKRFVAVFVSVDPARDTPEVLRGYANHFVAPILGLTGSPETLAELASRYGAQYRRVDLPGSALGYAVDHSAALYLIDPKGKLKMLFRHDAPPKRVAREIMRVLR